MPTLVSLIKCLPFTSEVNALGHPVANARSGLDSTVQIWFHIPEDLFLITPQNRRVHYDAKSTCNH